MGTDAVFEFLDALDGDADMRGALGASLEGDEIRGPEVARFAACHGFEFTVEDLDDALKMLASQRPEELTDDQLDAVSGGTRSGVPFSHGGVRFRNLGVRLGSDKTIEIVNG